MTQTYAKPLPVITPENAPFWEGCKQRRLVLQRCSACHAWLNPPRLRCHACGAAESEWVAVAGKGSIFSWIVVHGRVHPGFADQVPYAVVLVELDGVEGVHLPGNVVDCATDQIHIGMPVEMVFQDATPEVTIYNFRPATGA